MKAFRRNLCVRGPWWSTTCGGMECSGRRRSLYRFSYRNKYGDHFKIVVPQMTLSSIRSAFPSAMTFYRNALNEQSPGIIFTTSAFALQKQSFGWHAVELRFHSTRILIWSSRISTIKSAPTLICLTSLNGTLKNNSHSSTMLSKNNFPKNKKPSRELTYPTLRKGNSSSKVPWEGIC